MKKPTIKTTAKISDLTPGLQITIAHGLLDYQMNIVGLKEEFAKYEVNNYMGGYIDELPNHIIDRLEKTYSIVIGE